MKYLLIIPVFFFTIIILLGQPNGTVRGVLIDKETEQPIPFANVFFEDTIMHGTISNDLGVFELSNVPMGKRIQISHLLYDDIAIEAPAIGSPSTYHLQSSTLSLPTMVVDGKYAAQLIQKAYEHAKASEQVWSGKGFYRQLSQKGTTYSEVIESFCAINFSNKGIKSWEVKEGRYGKTLEEESFRFTNFSFFSRGLPMYNTYKEKKKKKKEKIIYVPVSNKSHYYTFEIVEFIEKPNGQEIAVVHCQPKQEEVPAAIYLLESWYYIDTEQYDIYQAKAVVKNEFGMKLNKNKMTLKQPIFSFTFSFRKDKEKGMVLDFINASAAFSIYEAKQFQYDFKVNSIFYCYETGMAKQQNFKKAKIGQDDLSIAKKARYNPAFWKNHSMIKKTPLEAKVITDFEKAGFLGNFLAQ